MALLDLHIHSSYSCDGQFSPEELVITAKEKGLQAIALTDHNSVKGLPEFLAAGAKHGVETVPGIEIDTVHNDREYHILGYFLDWRDIRLARLNHMIEKTQTDLIRSMVQTVCRLGFPINYPDVLAHTNRNSIPGFASIAKAVLEKHPHLEIDCFEFMRRFLAPNVPDTFTQRLPAAGQVIQLIRALGGVPVLAHPGQCLDPEQTGDAQIVRTFKDMGLSGVEAHSTYHSPGGNSKWVEHCLAQELLITAGSDFHGEFKPAIELGQNCETDYPVLEQLKRCASQIRKE